ncbi:substrate-binding domain-containing protein [Rhizobium sp. Root1220]|uniref:substrate-binding domain-containing protein n=1 Tax=Rhizobium sp. Root1220 TaxID=1736432 RepID=UPI0007014B9E|nr:substrate-binding domain-containing protein [Rhizobium sp. Root1220]KQV70482.1 transcriptional regulator [Rhizobium sp. Root1220]
MATLKQVALHAKCSVATASRVLNHSGPVSQAAVLRVRRAAAEIGYRTSGTTGNRTRRPVIGVLIPSIANPVFAASLSGIQNRMLAAGHGVLIAQSNYDPDQELNAVEALLSERPTGLILTVCDGNTSRALSGKLPPTVLLHNLPTADFPSAVTVNNHEAGRKVTEYLLSMGHHRILFVSGNFAASDRACLRYQGHSQAMAAAGCERFGALQISFLTGYDELDLAEPVARLRPTAIIASNDLLALGVIGALRRDGLRVPHDISVAGFDGISIGRLSDPQLTTIEMPDASMGTTAAALLLDIAENGVPPRHLELAHRLRKGGTVRAINGCTDTNAATSIGAAA